MTITPPSQVATAGIATVSGIGAAQGDKEVAKQNRR
jgi:hypothetical protein